MELRSSLAVPGGPGHRAFPSSQEACSNVEKMDRAWELRTERPEGRSTVKSAQNRGRTTRSSSRRCVKPLHVVRKVHLTELQLERT